MTDWKPIQTALRTLYLHHGTRKRVAEAVGVHSDTITSWKNQTKPPQQPSIAKLMSAVNEVPEGSILPAFTPTVTYNSLDEQKTAESAQRLDQLVDSGIIIAVKSLEAERDRLESAIKDLDHSLKFLRHQIKRIQQARAVPLREPLKRPQKNGQLEWAIVDK